MLDYCQGQDSAGLRLLSPTVPRVVALDRAELQRKAFAAATLSFGEFHIRVSLSIGVDTYPEHGGSPEELARRVDQALYRARAEGRNRVVAADPAHAMA